MRRLIIALMAAVALAGALPYAASGQICTSNCLTPPPPPPPPPPLLPPADPPVFVDNAVNAGLFDLGSFFLWKQLGSNGQTSPGNDSQGGGASPSDQVQQRFRTWGDGYGLWSKTSDFDTIIGDRRRTGGIVGGFGFVLAPGATVGFAVDQSWTKIDLNSLPQNARFSLTQLGANSQLTFGQFTL